MGYKTETGGSVYGKGGDEHENGQGWQECPAKHGSLSTDLSPGLTLPDGDLDTGLPYIWSRDLTTQTQAGFMQEYNPEIGCWRDQGWQRQTLQTNLIQSSDWKLI